MTRLMTILSALALTLATATACHAHVGIRSPLGGGSSAVAANDASDGSSDERTPMKRRHGHGGGGSHAAPPSGGGSDDGSGTPSSHDVTVSNHCEHEVNLLVGDRHADVPDGSAVTLSVSPGESISLADADFNAIAPAPAGDSITVASDCASWE